MRHLKSGTISKRRRTAIASLLAIGVFSVAAIAQADNVQNDVTAGGNDTFAAGGSTTINYRIAANSGDGQTGCNAADGSAAVVTISAPPEVTATPNSRTFTQCTSGSTTNAQSVVFSSSTPGDYQITVSVSDSGAGSYNTNPATFTLHVTAVTPTNHAPTVSTDAGNVSGNEGSPGLSNSGAFSDQDNDALTLSLGGVGSLTAPVGLVTPPGGGSWSWSYVPPDNGSGSVTVTADDGHVGGTASDSFNWSAANVAPTASITGAPTTSPEGTQISLGSSVTDPSSVDTSAGFTHAWSVTKNGVAYGASGSGANFSFTPDDEGTYVVSFSAKDKDGGEGTDSETITVTNVAPSNVAASFGPALSCTAAANATLSWTFVDPGSDTWNAQIDWNYDGTTFAPDETKTNVGKSDSATHSYGSAGTHVAAIRISDGDGGSSDVQTAQLIVNYNLSNILQPVNDTRNGQQTSMFKYGSTVPVKVEITDCDGSHPSNLDVRVTYAKTASNPPPVGTDEAVATNAPDGGNQMRFSDPIYIFNFGTKYINDSTATVRIDVSIPTTGQYTFAHIGLKAK